MSTQEVIFYFLGGLGIFLFGIKFLGDNLQKIAGDGLRNMLDRFTTNPIKGMLAGIFVTILLQTSTGTTVLTIGLVNAGFMTLRQAIGVIIGANIGTTATAFIIGINISEYALPIVALGSFMIFFLKSEKIRNVGRAILGFGALFLGLNFMSDGLYPLRDAQIFQDLTISMSDNPLLGVLIGTIFTMTIQSSSAAIGLLQTLFAQGAMTLDAALPVLFGDNIGTTITAVLAALGASITAKRAALVHVIFNVIGTVIVLILLSPFTALVQFLQGRLDLNPEMTIAFAHGIFNISNALIQLPFVAVLAWIVVKAIPGEQKVVSHKVEHLDEKFIAQSPSVAVGQAQKEVLRMAELAEQGLEETIAYFKTKKTSHRDYIVQYELAINNLDQTISDYLIKLSSQPLSKQDSELHQVLLNTIRDIERIGDHMENIMELTDYKKSKKLDFTETADAEIEEMFELVRTTFRQSIRSIEIHSKEEARGVVEKENEIDRMERVLRKNHIVRVNEGACTGAAGIVFTDIVSNLERIGDHSVNIAETVLEG
ncbi:phosphate:Na+ symporter [Chryseomicrobium aureum]|uniref:Na/Pi cotransporter family protein n=1 Tax=Chryseomicrobium aureum TaxID=1441723 RepID=UPI00195E964A|nr:Na/Pi cotransporter family protein [Chryseomicrobium aureum]MBM7706326.1 phosphate:Na+ symporter [Chryseomicrobium aureum]